MFALVEFCMDMARYPASNLTFGPLDAAELAAGGLQVSGSETEVSQLAAWARERGATVL